MLKCLLKRVFPQLNVQHLGDILKKVPTHSIEQFPMCKAVNELSCKGKVKEIEDQIKTSTSREDCQGCSYLRDH